ncbi:MAG: hypothetical protein ATN36_02415 [Epulopiscium sp. Nele67-Bin005]|nr:MAG: hypothetical protein ATN36_02415 [Epulopiscium sp. Nele67-Bin005]
MKKSLLLSALMMFGSISICATPQENIHISQSVQTADQYRMFELLEAICQQPRSSNLEENQEVIQLFTDKFQSFGYETHIETFDVYKQNMDSYFFGDFFDFNPYNENALYTSGNLIAYKPAAVDTEKTLILSAHYDTTTLVNGVIDNGSGVITVMEIAQLLQNYELPFNIEFILFGAEEYYLTGSRVHIYQRSYEDRENIIGVINIDMVGDVYSDEITIATPDGTNTRWSIFLQDNGLDLTNNTEGSSDQYPFIHQGIEAVLITDNKYNSEWFFEENPLDILDMELIANLVDKLVQMISTMDISNINNETHFRDINPNAIRLNRHIIPTIDNPISGYRFVDAKQQLLEDGTKSEVFLNFENDNGDKYTITFIYGKTVESTSKDYEEQLLLNYETTEINENSFTYTSYQHVESMTVKIYGLTSQMEQFTNELNINFN